MQTKQFTLPEWFMVGGESQNRVFVLCDSYGNEYDLSGGSARFSVVDFANRFSDPVLTKELTISSGSSGVNSEVSVILAPEDTVFLCGKYIYQISIKDSSGHISIPNQGIMYIINNIDKGFVGGVII